MPKGQLSRVLWPGNSWMPFTFQPALRVLQQPHKTITFTPASYSHWTSRSLHSICFINSFLLKGFFQSTAQPRQNAARPFERATSHIKVTPPVAPYREMWQCLTWGQMALADLPLHTHRCTHTCNFILMMISASFSIRHCIWEFSLTLSSSSIQPGSYSITHIIPGFLLIWMFHCHLRY